MHANDLHLGGQHRRDHHHPLRGVQAVSIAQRSFRSARSAVPAIISVNPGQLPVPRWDSRFSSRSRTRSGVVGTLGMGDHL